MTVANVDGTNAADVTVYIDTGAQTSSGGTVASGASDVYLAKTVSVPALSQASPSANVQVETPQVQVQAEPEVEEEQGETLFEAEETEAASPSGETLGGI